MSLDQTAIDYLVIYGPLAIFLGAFFFGESVIIAGAFLSSHGLWPIWLLFLLAFFGTIISDSIWFFGGFGLRKIIDRKFDNKTNTKQVINSVQKITKGKSFLALLFIKFLYGTRIITIIYLASEKLSFCKFTIFNSLGTIIWLTVAIFIGWSFGSGTKLLSINLNHIGWLILLLFMVIILFKYLTKWITQKINQE